MLLRVLALVAALFAAFPAFAGHDEPRPTIIQFTTGALSLSTSVTTYFGNGEKGAGAATAQPLLLPYAGTLSNLACTLLAPIASGSYALTIYDVTAAAAGNETVTLNSSAQEAQDGTHSDTVTAGHQYVIQSVPSTPATAQTSACTAELTAS